MLKKIFILIGTLCMISALLSAEEKMTCASYMGWYTPYNTGRGAVNPTDFSLIPLSLAPGEKGGSREFEISMHREELNLLAASGWNTIGVDGLFYDHAALSNPEKKHSIKRQLELMEYFSEAAKGLPHASIKMVPFIEFLAAYKQMGHDASVKYYIENTELMLNRFGSSDFWRRQDGRPIILVYAVNAFPAEFWKTVVSGIKERGHNPFWIMAADDLNIALYGVCDEAKYKDYLDVFDGVYSFGCSALLEGPKFPASVRNLNSGSKACRYIGATLWPGYLSERPYNRNFIAHDGTRFLRNVWSLTSPAKPEFLHWVFNDYKEATTLAPTFSTLSSRLEISMRFLSDYNSRALPVSENGELQSILSYRKALYSGEPLSVEFLCLPAGGTSEKKAELFLTLLDENDKVIAKSSSGMLDFSKMTEYRWNDILKPERKKSRVVKVRAELVSEHGKKIQYANLPDIAVVPPLTKADQLWYSLPLHKMASSERSVSLSVNGKARNAVLNEGIRFLSWKINGDKNEEASFAIARSGHSFRRMAAQKMSLQVKETVSLYYIRLLPRKI